MKQFLIAATMLAVVGCKNNPTPNQTATTGAKETASPTTAANSDARCAMTGTLKEKFEQNGAKFERFAKPMGSETHEWLKITLPDGSCKIVDSIGDANHFECTFEDWNGDGFKDRVDSHKWSKEVSLFSKTKNDFSDKIEGSFAGEQRDFDKAKGIKWQILESKMGNSYQLYKIEGLKVKVLSEVSFNDSDESITIEASATQKEAKPADAKTFLVPAKNGEDQNEASVKRYWESIKTSLK